MKRKVGWSNLPCLYMLPLRQDKTMAAILLYGTVKIHNGNVSPGDVILCYFVGGVYSFLGQCVVIWRSTYYNIEKGLCWEDGLYGFAT